MFRATVAMLAAAAVCLALTGCTTNNSASQQRDGRTLILAAAPNTDLTDLVGTLGENKDHCITIGDAVVIASPGTNLLEKGSVNVGGHTWKPGTFLHLTGSKAPTPATGPHCGSSSTHYWNASTSWTHPVFAP